jgi:hypothetical protein
MELTLDQKAKIAELQKICSALYPYCPDLLSAIYQMDASRFRVTADQLAPLSLNQNPPVSPSQHKRKR